MGEILPISKRLAGLETEYAIRYHGHPRPRHDRVYEALIDVIRDQVAVYDGDRLMLNHQVFVENGGAFYYEFQPSHRADGLVEGSTPECRGAAQLVLYQRAQERLLVDAVNRVHPNLTAHGFFGRVGLLKNSLDDDGHGFGTHENYEVDMARGQRLWGVRVAIALLLPLILLANLVVALLALVTVAVLLVGLVIGLGVALVFRSTRARLTRWIDPDERNTPLERVAAAVSVGVSQLLVAPFTMLYCAIYDLGIFRPHRRALDAHLASRMVYAGAGSLDDDGDLWVSQRARTLTGLQRWFDQGTVHVVFDSGNLIKQLWSPQFLRISPLFGLFRARQRMQIAYSDSNRCQVAEFLKVGTTMMILDMVDAGWLRDAPRFAKPFDAYRSLGRNPREPVPMADGTRMDALDLQRWYLTRALDFVRDHRIGDDESEQLIDLWGGVLDALEDDPSILVGRVDWVTKRYLLEATDLGDDPAAKKKIDLRYGELGTGYFDRLADRGLTLDLVEVEDIVRATRETPEDSPARMRAEILAELADSSEKVYVAWDRIRVGPWIGGRVISLHDRRRGGHSQGRR